MKYLLLTNILLLSTISFQCLETGNAATEHDTTNKTIEPNEDIVFIENAKPEDLQKALKDFCKTYNQGGKVAFLNLNTYEGNIYSITFRKPIPFDVLEYLINYLHYPFGIDHKPNIRAWATIKPDASWIDKALHNKQVMLYIPEDDKEYDNVYFITQENQAYKDSFRADETLKKVEEKQVKFESAKQYLKDLKIKSTVEVE